MKERALRVFIASSLAIGGGTTIGLAQGTINAAAQVHIEAAKRAAGTEHAVLATGTCSIGRETIPTPSLRRAATWWPPTA